MKIELARPESESTNVFKTAPPSRTHIKALPNQRLEVVINGVKFTGAELINGQRVILKKEGLNLILELDGEAFVEIDNFYDTAGASLDGAGWQFSSADALKFDASGVVALAEAAFVPQVAVLPAAASGGMSGLLAGLGLAALGGGGGGGGGSPLPTTPAQAALTLIKAAADANNASGSSPSAQTYTDAGISGVSSSNLAAINSVLNTTAVTGNQAGTAVDVQRIVDAYNKIFALADAGGAVTPKAAKPSAADYAALGLSGFSGSDASSKASFLGELIDRKQPADVNNAAALQTLANQVSQILGYTNQSALADKPTVAQINDLLPASSSAQPLVNANNLAAVQAAIASANSDGVAIASQAELSSVTAAAIAKYDTAMAKIAAYANDSSNPAPSVQDYRDAGIQGVTQDNLSAVNKQVDNASGNASALNTPDLIQTLVDNAAQEQIAALAKIAKYADNASNPAPTVDDYKAAGIVGVNAANLSAVNSKVDAAQPTEADTVAEVQGLANSALPADPVNSPKVVAALAKIAAYADNGRNPAPSVQDYLDAGIAGVNQVNLAAVNAKVDAVIKTAADEVAEVRDLAALGVLAQTTALAKITSYAENPLASTGVPTVNDYALAGIKGVSDANLTAANAKVDSVQGADATTVTQVQALVNSATANNDAGSKTALLAALDKIAAYADNSSNPEPSLQDYLDAGITGLDASGSSATQPTPAMINTVLATALVTKANADTAPEIQDIVKAYTKVLALADGGTASGTPLSRAEAGLLGVDVSTWTDSDPRLNLLNSMLDKQSKTGVDTADEINWLAQMASNIQLLATGGLVLSAIGWQDMVKMGLTNCTADNLLAFERAITAQPDDGSTTDSLSELQALLNTINNAVTQISTAAENNTAGNNAVSLSVLQAAGIQNLEGLNLPLLQGLLNSTGASIINGAAVDTVSEIQALVDAVQRVQQLANGTSSNSTPVLSDAQITALGLQNVINTANEKALFTDVLDQAAATAADEAADINKLATIVDRVYKTAAGTTPDQTLSAADLTALGLQNVDASLISELRTAIDATSNDGTGVNSLAKLQTLVNQVNLANQQATLTLQRRSMASVPPKWPMASASQSPCPAMSKRANPSSWL